MQRQTYYQYQDKKVEGEYSYLATHKGKPDKQLVFGFLSASGAAAAIVGQACLTVIAMSRESDGHSNRDASLFSGVAVHDVQLHVIPAV